LNSPAVVALLDQAKQQAQEGEGERAAATLERAIRIEPRNPWLWHRLAVLRLQQKRYRDAIDMANKSNALADTNRRLISGNYRVIADALAAAGDREGAAEARERSRYYDPGDDGTQ
jgi:tetratricopeptide (TPR) repeat protein